MTIAVSARLKLDVEVNVEFSAEGTIIAVQQPDHAALLGAAKARYPIVALRRLYQERAQSRLDEGLVRVIAADKLVYRKFERAAYNVFLLTAPGAPGIPSSSQRFSRRDGREASPDPFAPADRIHEEDLAALNAKHGRGRA